MELKKGLDVSRCDERTVEHRGGEQLDPGISSVRWRDRTWALPLWGHVRTQRHHQRAGYPQGLKRTEGLQGFVLSLPCLSRHHCSCS